MSAGRTPPALRVPPVPPVLVTGFAPFDGRAVNRSWAAVAALPDHAWLARRQLPVDFASVAAIVPELVGAGHEVLLMVGEAESAPPELAIERVALNVAHARRADNAGAQPELGALVAGAPLALAARWNAAAAVAALVAAGLPARVSHHAGTFCCNAALFHALCAAGADPASPRVIGFLHVPVSAPPDDAALARGIEQLLLTLR